MYPNSKGHALGAASGFRAERSGARRHATFHASKIQDVASRAATAIASGLLGHGGHDPRAYATLILRKNRGRPVNMISALASGRIYCLDRILSGGRSPVYPQAREQRELFPVPHFIKPADRPSQDRYRRCGPAGWKAARVASAAGMRLLWLEAPTAGRRGSSF